MKRTRYYNTITNRPMPKIICVNDTIEVDSKFLADIPFFEPMLEGGNFSRDSIRVEEDVQTFRKVVACFRDDFNRILYETDYAVYMAYCMYACIEPSRQFYISDTDTVHSVDEKLIEGLHKNIRIDYNTRFRRVPYCGATIQNALNWITSVSMAGWNKELRPITPEAVNFLVEHILQDTHNLRYKFIICGEQVIIDKDEYEFRAPFKTITKCPDRGIFGLLKKYIEDPICIEKEPLNWGLLKGFLEKNYNTLGRLAYHWQAARYDSVSVSPSMAGGCCCHRT